MMIIDHPHARGCWTTVEVSPDGDMKVVLVIETDIATSLVEDDFHEEAFSGLLNAAMLFWKSHPTIDSLSFRRVRDELWAPVTDDG
jgi:hypothetical protein